LLDNKKCVNKITRRQMLLDNEIYFDKTTRHLFKGTYIIFYADGDCELRVKEDLIHNLADDREVYNEQLEESTMYGAVCVFSREFNDTACIWLEEQRMLPSDKRGGNLFESSVSISNREGVAFVDSIYPLLYGISKELPSIYFDIKELLPESIRKQARATCVFLRVLAELNSREKLLKSFDWQSTEDVQFVPAMETDMIIILYLNIRE